MTWIFTFSQMILASSKIFKIAQFIRKCQMGQVVTCTESFCVSGSIYPTKRAQEFEWSSKISFKKVLNKIVQKGI